mmetsp:Transcript_27154/g.63277  ORF Transcript_27154/g.63277 Transcript_27154/m.63277 type:complete len:226 (-) Transcript_27154:377-1054(-)
MASSCLVGGRLLVLPWLLASEAPPDSRQGSARRVQEPRASCGRCAPPSRDSPGRSFGTDPLSKLLRKRWRKLATCRQGSRMPMPLVSQNSFHASKDCWEQPWTASTFAINSSLVCSLLRCCMSAQTALDSLRTPGVPSSGAQRLESGGTQWWDGKSCASFTSHASKLERKSRKKPIVWWYGSRVPPPCLSQYSYHFSLVRREALCDARTLRTNSSLSSSCQWRLS